MTSTLLRALVFLAVTIVILAGSVVAFARSRRTGTWLQLIGAAALVVVALAHVCEGLRVLPAMGWGRPDSPGHYLDLTSAVAGLVLTPMGFVLRRLGRRADQGAASRRA